jgi:hypothetical protein
MDSGSEGSFQIKRKALLEAIRTHERLMEECKLGKGSDRHLFGLMCIAEENNLPIPKLFSQKAFTTSGGHGNFVLSTSTCGYTGKILIKKGRNISSLPETLELKISILSCKRPYFYYVSTFFTIFDQLSIPC